MKKISYLLFALIAMFVITNVYAAEVNTKDALISCVAADGTCTLSDDIVLSTGLEIAKDVVLDLNGHTITPATTFSGDSLIIVLHGGKLTVKDSVGTGKISTGMNEAVFVGIKMTKAGGDDTKKATLVVNSGTIEGYSFGISGNGNPGRGNTEVVINGGVVKGLDDSSAGIFNPQIGAVEVNGGTVTGATGIEMRSGNLTVNGGLIEGTGETRSVTPTGNGLTTIGVGIAVSQHTTKNVVAVTVNDGTVKGVSALYQTNTQGNDAAAVSKVSVAVNGGKFEAEEGKEAVYSENIDSFISGGEFSGEVPEEYLASEEIVTKEQEDGTVLIGLPHTITVKTVKNGKVTVDKVEAIAGEKVVITATADKGYKADKLEVALVDPIEGVEVKVNNNSFVMPDADVEVSATFVKNVSNPATSDNFMMYAVLAIVSMTGLSVVALNRKRFN